MVKLLNKERGTEEQLKEQEQLAIVVNNQQELKELVKNINEIIKEEEEGINLNKKVIFILPKKLENAWKDADLPLFFTYNSHEEYFGLHYVDVDGELNIETVKKKLGNQDFSYSAFDKSARRTGPPSASLNVCLVLSIMFQLPAVDVCFIRTQAGLNPV